jgi:hypothetical protein
MAIRVKELNGRIVEAGKLDHQVIGIYCQDAFPEEAVPVASIIKEGHPCLAKALLKMSIEKDLRPVFVGGGKNQECCWGASIWLGFRDFPTNIEEMFSSDSPNPDSMRIKKTSKLCRQTIADIGKITPGGKYIVMRSLPDIEIGLEHLRSILCVGNSLQIRNLGAMVHYSEGGAFAPIMAPWGSGCATFITYPAGMASNAPKDTAFLSPMTPEANEWLPKDTLILGIPIDMAVRMAEGFETSFAAKRTESSK